MVLCHFEERGNIEAAEILEISVGALESLLVRARRSLRAALSDLAMREEGA
jgi:RNA polymerase sigma-70 factor (ECF subfamily)